MKYNYTEDFSTAGIEFDDIDLYVTPKYTLIKT